MGEFDPMVGPPEKAMGAIPPPPPPDLSDDQAPDVAELVPEVSEGMVRSILMGLGSVANLIDRQPAAPQLWKFTSDELDQLVPPLTRIANRNDVVRRALLHGDLVVIAMALGQYGTRNFFERKEATSVIDQGHQGQAVGADRPSGGWAPRGFTSGSYPDPAGGGNGAAVRAAGTQ